MKPWWKWPLALSIGWFAILVVLSPSGPRISQTTITRAPPCPKTPGLKNSARSPCAVGVRPVCDLGAGRGAASETPPTVAAPSAETPNTERPLSCANGDPPAASARPVTPARGASEGAAARRSAIVSPSLVKSGSPAAPAMNRWAIIECPYGTCRQTTACVEPRALNPATAAARRSRAALHPRPSPDARPRPQQCPGIAPSPCGGPAGR